MEREASPKAVWYGRTDPCDDLRGPKMRRGREHAHRCCERDGYQLVREYLDHRTSGLLLLWDRPAGARLRSEVPELQAEGVTLVLVNEWRIAGQRWHLDRIQADVAEWGWELRTLAIGEMGGQGGWTWKPAVKRL